jgi:protein SCO1
MACLFTQDEPRVTGTVSQRWNFSLLLDVFIRLGMRNLRQTILAVLAISSLALPLSACSQESTSSLLGYVPPSQLSSSGVSVTEQPGGKAFELKAQEGEVLIVYFGYTNCPDVCPTTLVAIKNAKKKIGALAERVDLAMITVDPQRDTANILPRYLSSFTDRFHALIPANDAELRSAENAFGATSSVTTVDGKIEVVHGGTAYLVDDTGMVVVQWPFGLDSNSMANDLTILLNERTQTK